MVLSLEGWSILTTPISFFGIHPATNRLFSYFITFQTLGIGALYKRRKAKPMIVFVGLASLFLIDIYDMESYNALHNMFAIIFFLCQPIIFFMEYRKVKDSLAISKGFVLISLIVLLATGFLPLPIFEVLSYTLLILFL